MRRAVPILVLFLAFAVACENGGEPPSLAGSLLAVNSSGFAHACAVAPGITLTARHVVDTDESDPRAPVVGFRWEGAGIVGLGEPAGVWNNADLALVRLNVEPGLYNPLASAEPAIGNWVWWEEYDWSSRANAYQRVIRSGRVSRVFAGHIAVAAEVAGGASGGCLVNAAGETVGIVYLGLTTNDKRETLTAVGVFGAWADDVRDNAARMAEQR
jgi:hypothetical protein